jgi:hypothetical protein
MMLLNFFMHIGRKKLPRAAFFFFNLVGRGSDEPAFEHLPSVWLVGASPYQVQGPD